MYTQPGKTRQSYAFCEGILHVGFVRAIRNAQRFDDIWLDIIVRRVYNAESENLLRLICRVWIKSKLQIGVHLVVPLKINIHTHMYGGTLLMYLNVSKYVTISNQI